VSDETFERVALEDPDGSWELVCGRLRRKPGMTAHHNAVIYELHRLLLVQLDPHDYIVSMDLGRVRIATGTFYVPDICVIPRAHQRRLLAERSSRLEVYEDPLPLVVEIWSPSTGDYDVDEKLREYQRRGDAEIWRIHPHDRTLTAWRRRSDGTYSQDVIRSGVVRPIALPSVGIDLSSLFAE